MNVKRCFRMIKMNQKGSFIKHELSTLARGEAALRGE